MKNNVVSMIWYKIKHIKKIILTFKEIEHIKENLFINNFQIIIHIIYIHN